MSRKVAVASLNVDGEVTGGGRRDWRIEGVLFSWVAGSALVFNAYYWAQDRS